MLRPKLNRIWTSSNSVMRRDPGDTKYIQGWIAEIPTYQVLNYLQYKADISMLALAERGIFEWGTDVKYTLGSVTWDESNGVIYISTVGSPDRSLRPSANLSQWTPSAIQVSKVQYDTVVNAINTHIADIAGNPHKLTARRLNAYNKNEIDNIIAQYRALVAAHVNDRNNPHQLTASGIGAVPVTGGTYTGDVIFNSGLYFDSRRVNKITRTGGLFLQANTAVLGIDSSGKVVAGTSASKSPVVTEDSFPGLKAGKESEYAVPPEAFRLPLIGDLNVYAGRPNVEIPFGQFDSQYGCLNFSNRIGSGADSANSVDDYGNVTPIVGSTTDLTICFDVLSRTARNSDEFPSVIFGLPQAYMYVAGSGNVVAGYTVGSGTSVSYRLTGPINTWYRLAATFDSSGVKLFVNGILVSKVAFAANKAMGSLNFYVAEKSADQVREWCVRNMRIWNTALSEKQVSTL